MTEALTHELTQAERENEAYRAYIRCKPEDRARLWDAFRKIHAERPAEVVRALEKARGLA